MGESVHPRRPGIRFHNYRGINHMDGSTQMTSECIDILSQKPEN
ncbi:hypothetical protein SBA1_630044 [Candidatus Sulfotelmatobacter kueseliae]|uniref:Uncharacterized protein n=1 Tax=Candidatus Sulfotelmatobacter kueseliae TaxID=2042962 RepID=A0A2U3L2E5_9BACT|nr:hypothetical protein SBA1_630044 [Candidatus Sulfotelmatobacter kueseliae]